MQLPIESFVTAQSFEVDTVELFNESFKCYKGGAYKAAYAFSYLAFLSVLKFRILRKSKAPAGMVIGQWRKIQKELMDVDKWEEVLMNQIQNQKNPVFFLNDELRIQVRFWKDRRNDCVHHKNNSITFSTVEVFWDFIIHRLPRFWVNGGKDELYTRIIDHYDVTKTPISKSVLSLVQLIPQSMDIADYDDFFNLVISSVTSDEFYDFGHNIFLASDPAVVNSFTSYFISRTRIVHLIAFITRYPQHVTMLKGEPKIVRRIWSVTFFSGEKNHFPQYCAMLRNNLLDDAEIDESIDAILLRLTKQVPHDPEDIMLLQAKGFYNKLKEHLFTGTLSMNFCNSKSHLYKHYLTVCPVDNEVITTLNELMDRANPPYSVQNRLSEILKENPHIKKALVVGFTKYSITPCVFLKTELGI
jgi:hypothetical protein